MRTTAAHELGHSFLLGDEYGGGGSLPTDTVTLGVVAAYANVQARATLLTGTNLDPEKIKWRWPRIRKAAVLASQPTPLGGQSYGVQLVAQPFPLFAVGDVVRFRLRPLPTAPPPSGRFVVTAVNGVTLDLEQLPDPFAAPFIPGNYVPAPANAPIVFAAVRGPDPNAAGRVFGPDLELVHAGIRVRMTTKRNPLNAADGEAPNRPCSGKALATPTKATNFPGGKAPTPPRFSAWIVGLYENGNEFDCDVYRPTGVCLMRRQHFPDTKTHTERSDQFCTVCRYALVDHLDPTLHGLMDALYAPRYPT
jgi:hypothetical protein